MRRLAYYAIGLAIGFMLLGLFQRLRTQEHAARMAEQEAQRGGSPGSISTPPQPAHPSTGGAPGAEKPGGTGPA
jgi:hypothetical protein